jgi:uncharacterized protein
MEPGMIMRAANEIPKENPMSLSMYSISVPQMIQRLTVLQSILGKGKAHAESKGVDEVNYTSMRAIPDMLPLAAQVRIACDIAKRGVAKLADAEPPVHADDETTFDQLKARCQSTIDYLKTFTPDQIDGTEEKDIVLQTPMGDFPFKGRDYVFGFMLANVHFHVTMTYALLRSAGVELGKKDYLTP